MIFWSHLTTCQVNYHRVSKWHKLSETCLRGVQEHRDDILVPVQGGGLQVTYKSNMGLHKMLTECILVGDGVDTKTIRKIWSGHFVEFAELISLDEPGIYDVTYTENNGNKQMQLAHRPTKDITNYQGYMTSLTRKIMVTSKCS